MSEKILEATYIQYFLTLVLFTFCTCCILRCLVCIVVSCLVCTVVVILCVLLSSYVYLFLTILSFNTRNLCDVDRLASLFSGELVLSQGIYVVGSR